MIAQLIPILGPIIGKVLDRFIPDKEAQRQAQHEITTTLVEHQQELDVAAASVIKAEAESKSWLASSWRPLTMLTFVALIVARWFGWAAPSLTPEEYLKLWDIVYLGLGGYVMGRTGEKILGTDVVKNLVELYKLKGK